MDKPQSQPKAMSKYELGERAVSMAHELETKPAANAMAEVHALKQQMRPQDYASMVRTIETVNKFDREQNPALPKVIITDKGGNKADVSGVARDVVDPKPAPEPKAEAPKPKPGLKDGDYPNTAAGREKLWRDFTNPAGK